MKKNILTLIPIVFTTIVAGTIVLYACTQQQELTPANSAPTGTDNVATDNSAGLYSTGLNRAIGASIDGDLGRKWIAHHLKTKGKGYSYTIPASELRALLDKGAMGISLYYALDDSGQLHVLPLGVDTKSTIMKTTDVLTTNGRIDWASSQKWIKSYSGEVRAHFFGADIYMQMLQQLKGEKVLVTVALNESNKPQLLMSDASLITPPDYKDSSMPCPFTCPTE